MVMLKADLIATGTDYVGKLGMCAVFPKAAVGFEPTDNGFANRPLWPLGYAAIICCFARHFNRLTAENQYSI